MSWIFFIIFLIGLPPYCLMQILKGDFSLIHFTIVIFGICLWGIIFSEQINKKLRKE